MRRPENVRRTASELRAFHEGRQIPGRFDSFRVVEAYRETAAAHGVRIPATYESSYTIGRSRSSARVAPRNWPDPGHNDLLNANFIDDGELMRIVDWEYAGMGDRFFDLANFSINH